MRLSNDSCSQIYWTLLSLFVVVLLGMQPAKAQNRVVSHWLPCVSAMPLAPWAEPHTPREPLAWTLSGSCPSLSHYQCGARRSAHVRRGPSKESRCSAAPPAGALRAAIAAARPGHGAAAPASQIHRVSLPFGRRFAAQATSTTSRTLAAGAPLIGDAGGGAEAHVQAHVATPRQAAREWQAPSGLRAAAPRRPWSGSPALCAPCERETRACTAGPGAGLAPPSSGCPPARDDDAVWWWAAISGLCRTPAAPDTVPATSKKVDRARTSTPAGSSLIKCPMLLARSSKSTPLLEAAPSLVCFDSTAIMLSTLCSRCAALGMRLSERSDVRSRVSLPLKLLEPRLCPAAGASADAADASEHRGTRSGAVACPGSRSMRLRWPPPRVPRLVFFQLCRTTPRASIQPIVLLLSCTFCAPGGGKKASELCSGCCSCTAQQSRSMGNVDSPELRTRASLLRAPDPATTARTMLSGWKRDLSGGWPRRRYSLRGGGGARQEPAISRCRCQAALCPVGEPVGQKLSRAG